MKKLSILCVLLSVLGFTVSTPFAATYQIDILEPGNPGGWTESLKTFDTEFTTTPQTLEMDIWITDAPGSATAGGFWLDFSGSTDKISYISAGRYLDNGAEAGTGPWASGGGIIANEPDGPGTLLLKVIQFASAVPDADGDIIIAKVVVEYTAPGTAEIMVKTTTSSTLWGPADNGWDDDEIEPATIILSSSSSPGSTTTSIFIDTTSSSTPSTSTTPSTMLSSTTSIHSTSSTTSSSLLPICVVEEIYGEDSEKVEILRHFRDTTLNKTQSGKEIIKLYYEWNPRMIKALKEDKILRGQVMQMMDQVLLLIGREKE